jgi:hypothetical protein
LEGRSEQNDLILRVDNCLAIRVSVVFMCPYRMAI